MLLRPFVFACLALACTSAPAAVITFANPEHTIATGVMDLNVVGFGHFDVTFDSVDSFSAIFGAGNPPAITPTFFGNMPGAVAAAQAISQLLSSGNGQVPSGSISGVGSRTAITIMVPVAILTDILDPPAVQSAAVQQDNPNAYDPPRFEWLYTGFVGVKPDFQAAGYSYAVFTPAATVPEPATVGMWVCLIAVGFLRRRCF